MYVSQFPHIQKCSQICKHLFKYVEHFNPFKEDVFKGEIASGQFVAMEHFPLRIKERKSIHSYKCLFILDTAMQEC